MNNGGDIFPEGQEHLAQRMGYLIAGFIRDSLSEQEHNELDDWVTASMENQRIFERLTDPANVDLLMEEQKLWDADAAYERIKGKLKFAEPMPKSKIRFIVPYVSVAAVLAIVVLTVIYYQKARPGKKEEIPLAVVKDISPGGNRATLTLSDGSVIALDSASKQQFSGKENISRLDSGILVYHSSADGVTEQRYNTLSTPKGGQYRLTLPDGTEVWLNAASSLRYPVAFAGLERKVELTGEGYFQVHKDPSHPFIVSASATSVKVLGTHFDVNTYADETTNKVTLEEGSVQVNSSTVIKPGQQAQVNRGGGVKVVTADLETTLAWKDGNFVFKEEPLDELMKQVARWYDAEIVYQATIPEHFNATIPRSAPVSELLRWLEGTGHVHFTIENKKITVMK